MGFAGSLFSGTNSDVDTRNENPLDAQDYRGNIQTGVNNYNQTYAGQNMLAAQLQALANGRGPNPATSMLTQAQDQNAQQAAGVYSNNRSVNPALAARQASNLQQQASGQAANQAATLSAQQQIAAQQNLGGLYNQMGNQALNMYGSATGGYNQAAGINAGIASGNQQATIAGQGAAMNAIGGLLGGMSMAKGGMVPGYDEGGVVAAAPAVHEQNPNFSAASLPANSSLMSTPAAPSSSFGDGGGAQSNAGKILSSDGMTGMNGGSAYAALENGAANLGKGLASGMKGMMGMAQSGASAMGGGGGGGGGSSMMSMLPMLAMAASHGGKVDGKAKKKGDSPANDTVPAMLSPGEIVIPRSVVNSKDPASGAAKFVQAVLARENMRKGKRQ